MPKPERSDRVFVSPHHRRLFVCSLPIETIFREFFQKARVAEIFGLLLFAAATRWATSSIALRYREFLIIVRISTDWPMFHPSRYSSDWWDVRALETLHFVGSYPRSYSTM